MQVYVARLVFQPLVFLPEVAVCLSGVFSAHGDGPGAVGAVVAARPGLF